MPKLRGTAMSLASFNMFVGGAIGTSINGKIISVGNIGTVFLIAAVTMFLAGTIGAIVVKKISNSKI
jgi:MFS family permease